MRDMELLKAGVDSQGDEFTQEALEDVVKNFKPGLPVTIGFDPMKPPVGTVIALKMEGGRIIATCELDDAGEKAAEGGMELAAGGTVDSPEPGKPMKITSMKLTGAALTDQKVK